jgi:serine protease inhibitor
MRPLLTSISLALSLGFLIQGCDSDGTGPSKTITELPRALTMAEEQIIARSNTFGFDLLREVDERRDPSAPNTVISPLSATMALGMALEGAEGETFEAMRDALRFQGLAREEINASYRGLLDLFLELDPEVQMEIANSTWAREGFPFVPAFFDAVTANFDAEVQELDFNDPGAKDIINSWVNEKTNGRISQIVDAIDPLDILFLINAVYFKGSWTNKFETDDTRPRPFHLEGGEEITVPTMSGNPEGWWGQVDGVQLGELPFGGQAFTMVFALPPEGQTVGDLLAELDDDSWNQWMGALQEKDQLIELPRFEVEWDGGLKNALAAMGMGSAFVPEADFSRLTPAADAHISGVKQKTFLKVDEEGAEAAAVTSVTVGATSVPLAFELNRPFLVAIRERLSGTVLFLGAIRDPR